MGSETRVSMQRGILMPQMETETRLWMNSECLRIRKKLIWKQQGRVSHTESITNTTFSPAHPIPSPSVSCSQDCWCVPLPERKPSQVWATPRSTGEQKTAAAEERTRINISGIDYSMPRCESRSSQVFNLPRAYFESRQRWAVETNLRRCNHAILLHTPSISSCRAKALKVELFSYSFLSLLPLRKADNGIPWKGLIQGINTEDNCIGHDLRC